MSTDLLYRFEGSLAAPAPVGPVAEGLRLDIPFEGRIVAGELAGGRAWGVEYLLQRRDGVAILDARDTLEIPGGHLHARVAGHGLAPDGARMPTVEEMLDPAFRPADLRYVVNAFAFCQTGVPEYEHLNRTLVKVDGWYNPGTGELVFEGRPAHGTQGRAGAHAERAVAVALAPRDAWDA
jgi:hypothetical protein